MRHLLDSLGHVHPVDEIDLIDNINNQNSCSEAAALIAADIQGLLGFVEQ